MLIVTEPEAVAVMEVAFQTGTVVEADAVADVMGLTEFLSIKSAATALGRKEKGGLTGPVRVAEGEGRTTEVRPVAAAEAHEPLSVQSPEAPPIERNQNE